MGEAKFFIKVKNMTLENYVKFYNESLYPLNYPYFLRVGLRAEKEQLSLILDIGIPRENYSIDEPTEYDYQTILTIYGDTDNEVIETFERLELHEDLKEYFKKIWDK